MEKVPQSSNPTTTDVSFESKEKRERLDSLNNRVHEQNRDDFDDLNSKRGVREPEVRPDQLKQADSLHKVVCK